MTRGAQQHHDEQDHALRHQQRVPSARSFLKNAQTWSRERLKSSKEWSLMDAEHPLGLSY
jgi:hypothetical protein